MKFKLVEAAESKICCICKKPFDGYGNNAEPVCSGSCCDECNIKEVIPARMKMLDKSSSENLNEALEDYKITYYLSTATAERRPETIEDVENDWMEETFAADSDYDACKYAFSIIHDIAEEDVDEYLDDYDIKDVREFVEYCNEKDLGDGSAFVVKLEGPNGVIYDMGQTKEDFIEQVKENDEMLSYYRSVLGIDESLNEAIDPSKALEIKKNSDADVIFYGYQYKNEKPVEIVPEEWSAEEYQNRKNQIVNDYNKLYADKPQANKYAKEHDFIFYALYNRKNESNEKDDNKMNEDMSVRAKLKAFYPELDFGDEVIEGFDDNMDFDIDECNEQRFMETLYNGADFDAYDDEALEESSDCEDDECWENDFISDDYDDGM